MSDNIDYDNLLNHICRIHFIGVGGVSMSALADIMRIRGYEVSGSDMTKSEITDKLEKNGVKVFIGHSAENVRGAQLCVYTAAVAKNNPELIEAAVLGIPCAERAPFFGTLMKKYRCPVGVCGTHGKTTTASMLSLAYIACGEDPTVQIGGHLDAIGGNYRLGHGDAIIFEACEYVDSFLNFCPKIALILNVEEDHLDYFSGIGQIKDSFRRFASICGADGMIVVNMDDKNACESVAGLLTKTVFYSKTGDADYCAKNISLEGFPSYDLYVGGEFKKRISLSVPGEHNISNSLAVFAVCLEQGFDLDKTAAAVTSFSGVHRRFEKKGEVGGVTIVDDYAHHPTEIEATIKGARAMNFGKIIAIFQPHTYSRTKSLFDEFARMLSLFDKTILIDIYAAREQRDPNVSSEALSKAVKNGSYANSFEAAARSALAEAGPGDLIITMGAGSVTEIGKLLLSKR